MKLRGKLLSSTTNTICFSVDRVPPELRASIVEDIREVDFDITVERHRGKRSLTANAYYWTLIDALADYMDLPKPVVHNMMLRDYGHKEIIDGDNLAIFLPDTEETEKEALRRTNIHLMPTSVVKGEKRAYLVLKNSSDMNSREFAALLDGVISEARQVGIETLSDEEFERIMKAYEEHHSDGK